MKSYINEMKYERFSISSSLIQTKKHLYSSSCQMRGVDSYITTKNLNDKKSYSFDADTKNFLSLSKSKVNKEATLSDNKNESSKLYSSTTHCLLESKTSRFDSEVSGPYDKICLQKTMDLYDIVSNNKPIPKRKEFYRSIILFSGRAMNDIGEYYYCSQSKKGEYFLINYQQMSVAYKIGICYFKECSVDLLNQYKPQLISIFSRTFAQDINPDLLQFIDSHKFSDDRIDKTNVGAYIWIAVTLCIMLLYFLSYILKPKAKITEINQVRDINHENKTSNNNPDTDKKNDTGGDVSKNNQRQDDDDRSDHFNNNQNDKHSDRKEKKTIQPIIIDNNEECKNIQTKENKAKSSHLSFLNHFDLCLQLEKILTVKAKPNDPFRILDGVRFLSAFWVLFGHAFVSYMSFGLINSADLIKFAQKWQGSIVYSGMFAVDVFFYLSAFMFYLGMQKYISPEGIEKKASSSEQISIQIQPDGGLSSSVVPHSSLSIRKKFSIVGLALFGRYVRLFPLYLFIVLGVTTINPFFYNGAQVHISDISNHGCLKTFWHNLLYVNNLVYYDWKSMEFMCANQTWYLANDMQFFVLFTVIFVFLAEKHLLRNLAVLLIIVGSLVSSIVICIANQYNNNDVSHNRPVDLNEFNDYYMKPWIRVAPYIIGLFFCEFYLNCPAYPKYKENQDVPNDNPLED
eukprot:CAMPEP_0170519286 /NCGR_PEP_ID=MMETSP0209-20121228/4766_1 /TAXON_ID=665100 ORGANISM="Litonotus pictus, Strain P1" /NCGR_SAMPLE_ID=MMETSP0209 /ASSEMBLY_ACC=CAM_ASM_000301 /LENGTH=683 /DNA_ID=CAMNT_0010805145 /DNA_START=96 /DNA_END=2148 /DNA_ORIENTATION=+